MKPSIRPHLLSVVLLLLASACSSDSADSAAEVNGSPTSTDATLVDIAGLRIDMVPTDLPTDAADVVPLPQSFPLPTVNLSRPFDSGQQRLVSPQTIEGRVFGAATSPMVPVASLPGDDVETQIGATILLGLPDTVQTYRARTDDEGRFAIQGIPGTGYELTIIPDEPSRPLTVDAIELLGDTPLDLDVGYGAAVYGHVRQGGLPVEGARLHLIADNGAASATALTDPSGFFHVTAQPGTYTLAYEGREFTLDPQLLRRDVLLDEDGVLTDLDLPAIDDVIVDGLVLSEGDAVEGLTVRFVAKSIAGLESQVTTFESKKLTDANGGFILRLPAGVYDVTVEPPPTDANKDWTPVALGAINLTVDTDLSVIQILPVREVVGSVVDPAQQRIEGALVSCRELEFGRRSWSALTEESGRFTLRLPQVPVLCAITPPAERVDLALTRRTFDPKETGEPTLALSGGQTLLGQATRDDGGDVGFVVVEVRDRNDELLGSALTDEEGSWSLQIAP